MNVQNEQDIADWPCFAKYYVTFPLGSIPAGKSIVSAQLTMYQFGSAGASGNNYGVNPSLIQLSTVGQDFNPGTVTWNTAPYVRENVSQTWVNPVTGSAPYPGAASTWDLGAAVAEAYAAGQPLRLAVYEADAAYNSGKYFWTSEMTDANATGRPTLAVTWGN